MGCICVAGRVGISSTTFTQCASKAIEFAKITQNNGHYAVQVIQDHRFCHQRKLICDFLLVINTNLLPILHRFRDIAFDRSKIAIFGYPSCSTHPAEGYPVAMSVQWMSTDGQGTCTKCRRNIVENFNHLSRAHERYRRQTDRERDRRTGDSI